MRVAYGIQTSALAVYQEKVFWLCGWMQRVLSASALFVEGSFSLVLALLAAVMETLVLDPF